MQFKLVATVVAVTVLGLGVARADVRLGATVSRFGYEVSDLRPGDGIAPALRLDPAGYVFSVTAFEGPWVKLCCSVPPGFTVNKGGLFHEGDAVTRSAAIGRSDAAFGISGAFADHSFEWFLRGNAANTRGSALQASGIDLAAVGGTPGFHMGMTVGPHTQVVWSGQFTLEAEQTLGRRGARIERSSLSGGLSLLDENGESLGGLGRFTSLLPAAVDRQRDVYDIRIVFANDSAGTRRLSLEGSMSGAGQSFYPVPEPGTNGLMLCGLGVLAVAAGRRRRAAR